MSTATQTAVRVPSGVAEHVAAIVEGGEDVFGPFEEFTPEDRARMSAEFSDLSAKYPALGAIMAAAHPAA